MPDCSSNWLFDEQAPPSAIHQLQHLMGKSSDHPKGLLPIATFLVDLNRMRKHHLNSLLTGIEKSYLLLRSLNFAHQDGINNTIFLNKSSNRHFSDWSHVFLHYLFFPILKENAWFRQAIRKRGLEDTRRSESSAPLYGISSYVRGFGFRCEPATIS
jgi:hypothetical protein